jgi:hypothetical protein
MCDWCYGFPQSPLANAGTCSFIYSGNIFTSWAPLFLRINILYLGHRKKSYGSTPSTVTVPPVAYSPPSVVIFSSDKLFGLVDTGQKGLVLEYSRLRGEVSSVLIPTIHGTSFRGLNVGLDSLWPTKSDRISLRMLRAVCSGALQWAATLRRARCLSVCKQRRSLQ